jgi:prevent-host-death family protein
MPATASRSVSVGDLREHFADLTNRVSYAHERIIVTRRGAQVAALISIEDLALLDELFERLEDESDLADARAALHDPENGTARVSWDDLKANLGL